MRMHWTEEQLRAYLARTGKVHAPRFVRGAAALPSEAQRKPNKHRNVKVALPDGEKFDSKLEYREYLNLRRLEDVGKIRGLRRQVKFALFTPGGEYLQSYTADFVFDELVKGAWRRVVGDVKSPHTKRLPTWPRIKRLMMACHQIQVREMP